MLFLNLKGLLYVWNNGFQPDMAFTRGMSGGSFWEDGFNASMLLPRIPFLLVAIDPREEAKLVQLDKAITSGRYLSNNDKAYEGPHPNAGRFVKVYKLPTLTTDRSYLNLFVKTSLQTYKQKAPIPKGALQAEQIDRYIDRKSSGSLISGEFPLGDKLKPLAVQSFWIQDGKLEENRSGAFSSEKTDTFFLPGSISYKALTKKSLGLTLEPTPLAQSQGEVYFRNIEKTTVPRYYLTEEGRLDLDKVPGAHSKLENYVPLGIYQAPNSFLKASADGRTFDPKIKLYPTDNPAGLLQSTPMAFTTLDAARIYRGADFINAIRIRARSGSDLKALAKEIVTSTGLHVDIVKGSSPQRISLFIPGYRGAPALGYAEQLWTTLGTAIRIRQATNVFGLTLFALVSLLGYIYIVNMSLSYISKIRYRVRTLWMLGWDKRQIFASFSSFPVAFGLLVGVAILVLGWYLFRSPFFSRTQIIIWSSLCTISILFVSELVLGVGVRRLGRPRTRERRTPALAHRITLRGVTTLAARNATRRRLPSFLSFSAGFLGGMLTSMLMLSIFSFRNRISLTLLGGAINNELAFTQAFLVGMGMLLTLLIAFEQSLVLIIDRKPELDTLKALGWPRPVVFRLVASEIALLTALGALLGSVLGIIALPTSSLLVRVLSFVLGSVLPLTAAAAGSLLTRAIGKTAPTS